MCCKIVAQCLSNLYQSLNLTNGVEETKGILTECIRLGDGPAYKLNVLQRREILDARNAPFVSRVVVARLCTDDKVMRGFQFASTSSSFDTLPLFKRLKILRPSSSSLPRLKHPTKTLRHVSTLISALSK